MAWPNEFSTNYFVNKICNFLVIYSMVAAGSCANGQPYTSATVSGDAFAGVYAQSNSNEANGFTSGDFSSGFSVWTSGAQADSTFGANSLYTETSYAYEVGYGDPSYGTNPAASASYSLNWSTAGGIQSGTIVSEELGLGGSIDGQYAGSFSFVYGTPYNIQSLLTVGASFTDAASQADSIWDDTFTFVGQPDGTTGTATFTVSLDGSISEQESQYSITNLLGILNFNEVMVTDDFNNGASLAGISLPPNTSIDVASGTIYGTPEPSTFALIGTGLGSLYLCRSRRKFWSRPA